MIASIDIVDAVPALGNPRVEFRGDCYERDDEHSNRNCESTCVYTARVSAGGQ
jgi:hypothetical protein